MSTINDTLLQFLSLYVCFLLFELRHWHALVAYVVSVLSMGSNIFRSKLPSLLQNWWNFQYNEYVMAVHRWNVVKVQRYQKSALFDVRAAYFLDVKSPRRKIRVYREQFLNFSILGILIDKTKLKDSRDSYLIFNIIRGAYDIFLM